MVIFWKEEAQEDLKRIESFLKKNTTLNKNDIQKIITILKATPQKLLQHPRRWQEINITSGKEIRRMLVKGYKIYYEIWDNTILILSVLHDKEDIEGITE